ncbi:MAG: 4Fe-4S dicluster domain-containing protein [Chloroflexi bacterium]|nr:4Fe-4S dicluster domain-containing protein [Chloroflexota bacterium]
MELAFLAFLVAAEAEAYQVGDGRAARHLRREIHQFLNDHVLAWLPQVGRALVHSDDPHFAMCGHLLEDFLKEEQLRMLVIDRGRAQSNVPWIADSQQCGLCGFCVQICPTDALWISENEAMTYLLLKPENCVGCAKCLPVCPDDALRMIARTKDLTQTMIVRSSPRALCPRCGSSTVSQAEMTAVFASLEADVALKYRLSLCGSCKSDW